MTRRRSSRDRMVLVWTVTIVCLLGIAGATRSLPTGRQRRRSKPRENAASFRNHGEYRDDQQPRGDDDRGERIHLANMTCHFISQPLNHFALPRNASHSYRQRYCVYDRFVDANHWDRAPILFYTGNESPLDQYINNTGLMWELAPKLGAQVVFAEHRYEGVSLPSADLPHCMAFSSSIQALADFAALLEHRFLAINHTMYRRRPIIAFGGSYGGMLAAWMRIKYPNIIQGAIAASAPVAGFPYNDPPIDSAARVIADGLRRPYPPTSSSTNSSAFKNYCFDNLLASWSLISVLEQSESGRTTLTKAFRLCDPLQVGDSILDWAQSPWFDLAEGSFPYPSSYIIFALTKLSTVQLPAWPLQAACWTNSSLHRDFGVSLQGNVSNVTYSILLDNTPIVSIDWDQATLLTSHLDVLDRIAPLLENVRDAIAIWFNATHDVPCFHPNAAPNSNNRQKQQQRGAGALQKTNDVVDDDDYDDDAVSQCTAEMAQGSWPALCCNEEMNLVITVASGLGNDFLWPPTHPRGTKSYRDMADHYGWICDDPNGYFGYPQTATDPWSTAYETYYGNTRLNAISSNIIYSNGLLDPWSAAGVYNPTASTRIMDGLTVQTINNASTYAIIMDYGGHHTDLMYSDDRADPPSIRMARQWQEGIIREWIAAFWQEGDKHDDSFSSASSFLLDT
jgi:Serine carboxypeptidase S28